MNPERISHTVPELTTGTPEHTALATTLAANRDAYVEAKQNSRSWFKRLVNGRNIDTQLNATRTAYEETKARMIQIESRRETDSLMDEATGDAEYRLELATRVAENIIREERLLTQREVEENRSTIFSKMKAFLGDHPKTRMAIGLGLNAAIGLSATTGALPLTWALIGTRVALGAMGTEGMLESAQNAFSGSVGARGTLTEAQIAALPIDQINNRIASFSEHRIKNRDAAESNTERLLRERRQEIIRANVQTEFTTEGLTNWQRNRAEATSAELNRDAADMDQQNAEIERAAAEAERIAADAARTTAETARDAAEADRVAAESERSDAEIRRDLARNAIDFNDGVLSDDRTRGGLIDNVANVPLVETACQNILDAEARIDALNAMTPPPANLATLIAIQRGIQANERTNNIMPHTATAGSALEAGAIFDAYRDRNIARQEETDQETRRDAAETARDAAETARDDREADRIDAENDYLDAEARENAWADERDDRQADMATFEAERVAASTLTQDQATRIHNILIGGAAAGVVHARATGIIRDYNEALNLLQEKSVDFNRTSSQTRWIAAIALSGIFTWLTTPEVNLYDWKEAGIGPNPDLNFVPGNPDVSSLWGRSEGLYWDYLNRQGANLVSEADFRSFVNSDPATHAHKMADYVNWVKINNPEAVIPGNPDWVKHIPIREPGDLDRFFGTWAGPHQFDPARSFVEAFRNLPNLVPNLSVPNLRWI